MSFRSRLFCSQSRWGASRSTSRRRGVSDKPDIHAIRGSVINLQHSTFGPLYRIAGRVRPADRGGISTFRSPQLAGGFLLPYALIVFALLVWSVLVSITTTLLAAPFLLLCAVSGTIAADSAAERRRKIWLFVVVAIFLALAGPGLYLIGIVLDTAAVTFPDELANNRASFYFASILFHWDSGAVGPILVILGVAGAVIAAFDKSRRTLRIFAMTLLTYLGTRLAFAVLIIEFDFWRGPAPLYFEFFVIPVYAVFAALFCARLFERIWRLCGLSLPRNHVVEIQQVAVTIAVMFMLVLAENPLHQEVIFAGFPYLPARPNLRSHRHLFRGRPSWSLGSEISPSFHRHDREDSRVSRSTGPISTLWTIHWPQRRVTNCVSWACIISAYPASSNIRRPLARFSMSWPRACLLRRETSRCEMSSCSAISIEMLWRC